MSSLLHRLRVSWPVLALCEALHFFVSFTGHVVGIVLGIGLTFLGVFLTVTVVAAPLGVALAFVGVLLLFRCAY